MITRLYIHNYRALVSFELELESAEVLCGLNGAGKSSVFDAVQFVSALATGRCFFGARSDMPGRVVPQLELTSWLQNSVQEFELDITYDGYNFRYVIHLEQQEHFVPRVIKEYAICNGKELYTRDLDGVHFDGGRAGFPLDWHQAALASIQPVPERKEIESLQKALMQILILRPDIHSVEAESRGEYSMLDLNMCNLISWYRYLYQDQEFSDLLRDSLKAVWSDFKFLTLDDAGRSVKVLKLRFEGVDILFDQLSDGEKMLVGLYTVHAALALGKVETVLIDEPDNFVGLQELQPWFLSMIELTDEKHQVLIISHNGEILNVNAAKTILFSRDGHASPTRVGALQIPEGMTPGEVLARGWGELQ